MKSESVSTSQCFQTYTGTKTIKAIPMGASDAKHYGAQITDETIKKNIGNDGYLVEYPDGYRSWSPKKVFDEAYKVSTTKVDRMKIELAGLNERMKDITDNLFNPDRIIHPNERYLLGSQLNAMRKYAEILSQRIEEAIQPRVVASADNSNRVCSSEVKQHEN